MSKPMDELPRSTFCWVRVLEVGRDAATTGLMEHEQVNVCGVTARNGGRPPRMLAAAATGSVSETGELNRNLQVVRVAWLMDPEFSGSPLSTHVLDHGPAFTERNEAVTWREGGEGRAWADGAVTVALMEVRRCDPMTTLGVPPKADIDNGAVVPREFRFPWDAWSDYFGEHHLPRRGPDQLLLRPENVPWCAKPNYADTDVEIGQMVQWQRARVERQEKEITVQAQSLQHAIAPVFKEAQGGRERFMNKDGRALIAWVTDSVDPVVFRQKRYHLRARPYHRSTELRPLFARPSQLHPGHPSYPSGHSTHAHVWAELLARRGAGSATLLHRVADEIAHNREIAGVHFPSDSEAGRVLAQVIVDHMLDPQRNPMHGEFMAVLGRMAL